MIQLSMELEKIKEYIDILDEREKEVIVKRFGLGLDMRRRNERLRRHLVFPEAMYQELKSAL